MRPILALALVGLVACDRPQEISGTVKDIFGSPIPGAIVRFEEGSGQATTDAAGAFQLEVEQPGDYTLAAGAEHHIMDRATATVPADDDEKLPPVDFALWPLPEAPGFHAAGDGTLIHLATARVSSLGSGPREVHGVRDLPSTTFTTRQTPRPFLFRSTLRSSEISQLDLELYRLQFQEQVTLPGLTGQETVEAKLWTAAEEVPFTLKGMPAKDVYMITPEKPLEEGVYAFASQRILRSEETGSLDRLPAEMQVVYPFEIGAR